MKSFAASLLVAVAVVAVPASASASPDQSDYKVICTQAVVGGDAVGPQVCVPLPVEP